MRWLEQAKKYGAFILLFVLYVTAGLIGGHGVKDALLMGVMAVCITGLLAYGVKQ